MEISNENQIMLYLHCGLCIKEHEPTDMSRAEYARTQAGWTKKGIQIWCNRHDVNVLNIDFEGQQHPAITTRKPKGAEK